MGCLFPRCVCWLVGCCFLFVLLCFECLVSLLDVVGFVSSGFLAWFVLLGTFLVVCFLC